MLFFNVSVAEYFSYYLLSIADLWFLIFSIVDGNSINRILYHVFLLFSPFVVAGCSLLPYSTKDGWLAVFTTNFKIKN